MTKLAPRLIALIAVAALAAGCAEAERIARDAIDATDSSMPAPTAAEWRTTASRHSAQDLIGRRFAFDCPANGHVEIVWGTDPYTADSSVCTAGVHAGVITVRDGGRVIVEMRPGQESYGASTRNGITTRTYGSWRSSFSVVR